MDYGCEMPLLQDGAQLQLQLQPEEFVAIADYTATDETQVSAFAPHTVTYEFQKYFTVELMITRLSKICI